MSIPTSLAASTRSMPLGATSCWPLIVSLTVSAGGDVIALERLRACASPWVEGTRALVDVALILVAVLLHGGHHGAGGEVAQGAQHLAADLARERQQQVQVGRDTAPLLDPRHHLEEPRGSLAARRAFAARLVAEELLHHGSGADYARVLVKYDERRRAKHRAGRLNRVVVKLGIELVRGQDRCRDSGGKHAFDGLAANDSLAVAVDQVADRDGAQRQFIVAGLIHATRQAENLRSGVARRHADAVVPATAAVDDRR